MKEKILKGLDARERWFVFFSMLTGFFIAAEYAITRPASHALFVTVFSSKLIPWLWMATVPVNLGAVYLYNRLLPKIGPLKMWGFVCASVMLVNTGAAFLCPIFPEYIFVQCLWKDIYILLMFKQLWSMIHTTIAASRSKYLYGMIFAMGTLGSCFGSMIPGFGAVSIGSEQLFLLTIPMYLALLYVYRKAFSRSLVTENSFTRDLNVNPKASEGFALIARNRYLAAILFLVIAMQVSAGFMEFRFNMHLETSILDKDLRTSYCGWLFGIMNVLSMGLQAVGSFLVLHFFGLRNTHFMIPMMLLGSLVCSLAIPSFALISLSYIFLKAIDFSLFSIGREMLYIPFGLDEKYRAKAVIDVFAYRSSKALVSVSILALQALAGAYILEIASYVSIAIFVVWIVVVFFMVRSKEAVAAETERAS